ncbi:hypothetical protein KVT40_006833 [Elsinoe batatas]|uniref:Uncharacterized protein n=1 Tax=Elsinoe batatas TaxID=2601811 RepID=A0A8K0PDZ4_9PEZI|nr:hypothetical protein KVT40_006833 [Elsinoe batatas]
MAHEFGRKEHLFNILASEMDSSADILNLSLCNKDIHKIVFPWLYRHIEIHTPRKLERVTKLMYDRPDLAKQLWFGVILSLRRKGSQLVVPWPLIQRSSHCLTAERRSALFSKLSWRESELGLETPHVLGFYRGINASLVLPALAGFRHLKTLTLGNFELVIHHAIPLDLPQVTHLELIAPHHIADVGFDPRSVLQMMNPLTSLIIKLGHPRNTDLRDPPPDDMIDGELWGAALVPHHLTLQYLKIQYFDCVTNAECGTLHRHMSWTRFQKLRRLEIPFNFVPMANIWTKKKGARRSSELVKALPTSLEKLGISRTRSAKGLEEDIQATLPKCRLVLLGRVCREVPRQHVPT